MTPPTTPTMAMVTFGSSTRRPKTDGEKSRQAPMSFSRHAGLTS
jgi:hypothetical protein